MAAPKDMPFDGALWGLKRGARMTRASWNARGQWVALVKRPERLRIPAVYRVGMDSFDTIAALDIQVDPYFILHNAQGRYSTWVPSIGDLLAEDWQEQEWGS